MRAYLKTCLVTIISFVLGAGISVSYAAKTTDGTKLDLTEIEARLSVLESQLNPSVAGSTYLVLTQGTAINTLMPVGVPVGTAYIQIFQQSSANQIFVFDEFGTGTINAVADSCPKVTNVNVYTPPTPSFSLLDTSVTDPTSDCSAIGDNVTFSYTQSGYNLEINDSRGYTFSYIVSGDGSFIANTNSFKRSATAPDLETGAGYVAIGMRVPN